MAENKQLATIGSSKNLMALVENLKPRIIQILPKHLSPERFVKLLLTAAVKNPKILSCTRDSLISSMILSAEIGLEINSAIGSGAIVPFWNGQKNVLEAQFMPMYRGLQMLATNHESVLSLNAQLVYENDKFDWGLGDTPFVTHKPALANRGEIIASYSVCWLKGSPIPSIEIMNADDLNRVQQASQTGRKNQGAWKDWADEMKRKAVTKRHIKRLPCALDPALSKAIDADDVSSGFKTSLETDTTVELVTERPKQGVDAFEDKIETKEIEAPVEKVNKETGEVTTEAPKESVEPAKEPEIKKEKDTPLTKKEREKKVESCRALEDEIFGEQKDEIEMRVIMTRRNYLKADKFEEATNKNLLFYEMVLIKRLEEENEK